MPRALSRSRSLPRPPCRGLRPRPPCSARRCCTCPPTPSSPADDLGRTALYSRVRRDLLARSSGVPLGPVSLSPYNTSGRKNRTKSPMQRLPCYYHGGPGRPEPQRSTSHVGGDPRCHQAGAPRRGRGPAIDPSRQPATHCPPRRALDRGGQVSHRREIGQAQRANRHRQTEPGGNKQQRYGLV